MHASRHLQDPGVVLFRVAAFSSEVDGFPKRQELAHDTRGFP
jgi:hypothetical protein